MGMYPPEKFHIAMESPVSSMISLDLPIENGDFP